VHNLALQLRPSVLDDMGLPAAIQHFVDDCRNRYPLRIDLAVRGFDQQRLPANVETALYRIIQESLTNVVRHAKAQTASVLIESRDGVVRAVVEDDGCGFDPSSTDVRRPHLGLYGIRERAELLGGKVTIESSLGQGTSLFIEIPWTP
jgi:signal transduction histidine kinase